MKKTFLLIASITVTLLAYQNCSKQSFSPRTDAHVPLSSEDSQSTSEIENAIENDKENSTDSNSGDTFSNGNSTGTIKQEEVEQVKLNCDTARQSNKLITLNEKIIFDDTKVESQRSPVCSFGVDDNLSTKNQHMQARYEQLRTLNVPANAVICDLNMTTPLQGFKYDDVFIFTFNNRVLATNNKKALYQSKPEAELAVMNSGKVPIYKYDWLTLRSLRFENVVDDYCLGSEQGASSCRWPLTERSGSIQFDFDQQLLIALGLLAPSEKQQFSFVITGDDNPDVDCYHERLEFDMSVEYYLK